MLLHRLFTAAILIVIALVAIFLLPPWQFYVFTLCALFVAAWEWGYIIGLKTKWAKSLYAVAIASFTCVSMVSVTHPSYILSLTFFWWIFVFRYVKRYPKSKESWCNSLLLKCGMGLMTLIPCIISINLLHNIDMGSFFLVYLFLLTFGTDSGAYFAGRKWGKGKMAPNVSPGKTYQGMFGGVTVGIVLAIVAGFIGHIHGASWVWWLGIAVATSFISILGDLFISMMKRAQGVKDTGGILPGHGGILDRVDSLLASAPMFTLGLLLMGYYKG